MKTQFAKNAYSVHKQSILSMQLMQTCPANNADSVCKRCRPNLKQCIVSSQTVQIQFATNANSVCKQYRLTFQTMQTQCKKCRLNMQPTKTQFSNNADYICIQCGLSCNQGRHSLQTMQTKFCKQCRFNLLSLQAQFANSTHPYSPKGLHNLQVFFPCEEFFRQL